MTPPRAATPAGRRTSGASAPRAPREEIRITAKSKDALAGAARAAVRASAAAAGPRTAPAAPRHASRSVAGSAGQRTMPRSGGSGRAAVPRRVSGPLSGRVAAAAAAVALPQRAPVPLPAPRRRPTPVTRPSRRDLPGGARALAWVRGLPDHRLLDRLIGGRVWIVLIGTLLVGIVTMQLSLLKLNAGIGRAVERGSQLEQRNATLRATISRLSDGDRVIAAATGMGYVVPPQGSPRFLRASASDARAALTVMRVPQASPTTTATTLAATGTVAAETEATTTDPTAAADTTTGVTSDPTAATDTTGTTTTTTTTTATAPAATAPATTTSGAAGTTTAGATSGTTVAGGATAPTQP